MAAPASRRAHPHDDPVPSRPTIPPPPDPQRPASEPPIRLKYGGFEIAAKGASALYALALFGCFVIGSRVVPPIVDAARELTTAMQASAETLRRASADATAAREGVEKLGAAQVRVEERLGRIESDVSALRIDLRASCAVKR